PQAPEPKMPKQLRPQRLGIVRRQAAAPEGVRSLGSIDRLANVEQVVFGNRSDADTEALLEQSDESLLTPDLQLQRRAQTACQLAFEGRERRGHGVRRGRAIGRVLGQQA